MTADQIAIVEHLAETFERHEARYPGWDFARDAKALRAILSMYQREAAQCATLRGLLEEASQALIDSMHPSAETTLMSECPTCQLRERIDRALAPEQAAK